MRWLNRSGCLTSHRWLGVRLHVRESTGDSPFVKLFIADLNMASRRPHGIEHEDSPASGMILQQPTPRFPRTSKFSYQGPGHRRSLGRGIEAPCLVRPQAGIDSKEHIIVQLLQSPSVALLLRLLRALSRSLVQWFVFFGREPRPGMEEMCKKCVWIYSPIVLSDRRPRLW